MTGTPTAQMLLIDVRRTDGQGRALRLDPSASLKATRTTLARVHLMLEQDHFLRGDFMVERSQEDQIPLRELLGTSTTLAIGGVPAPELLRRKDGADHYNQLAGREKIAVLDNVDVRRGRLPRPEHGLATSAHELYTWPTGYLPAATQPAITSEKSSSSSFSELTRHLAITGVKSGSASLTSPYASAKAEYEHTSEKSTDTHTVTEYLTSRFTARKAELSVDPGRLSATDEFAAAVAGAVDTDADELAMKRGRLLKVLDTWGYFLPTRFTIGGAIYATQSTTVKDFEQAEKERNEFSASFEATFWKIGASASYKQADGKESHTKTTDKYTSMTLQVLGGEPVTSETEYAAWVTSLEKDENWTVIAIDELAPALVLLRGSHDSTLTNAIRALDGYSGTHGEVLDVKAYLDMVQEIVDA
ncbi:hypothetical protein ACFXKD_13540 [Nocardiopsis aegyptia]|uniref:hypothetical protein n=1 Tax=Nocardiopsis aegyptia TaxID=220378 RepID=UPI0036719DD6